MDSKKNNFNDRDENHDEVYHNNTNPSTTYEETLSRFNVRHKEKSEKNIKNQKTSLQQATTSNTTDNHNNNNDDNENERLLSKFAAKHLEREQNKLASSTTTTHANNMYNNLSTFMARQQQLEDEKMKKETLKSYNDRRNNNHGNDDDIVVSRFTLKHLERHEQKAQPNADLIEESNTTKTCKVKEKEESNLIHEINVSRRRVEENDDENQSDILSEADDLMIHPGAYAIPGGASNDDITSMNDTHFSESNQVRQGEEDFLPIEAIGDEELVARYNIRDVVQRRLINGLNIATEVTSNDDQQQQQGEEENNNRSKRIGRYLMIFGIGFLVVVAFPLSILLSRQEEPIKTITITTTDMPSESPTSLTDFEYGQQLLLDISGDTLNNVSSYQYKALEWLVYDDLLHVNLKEELDTSLIINRYVFTLLFFTTNGPNWFRNNNFLSNTSVCDWEGIICNGNGEVTDINLARNNLNGTIPMELAAIKTSEFITFYDNKLYGTIPSSFGELSRLDLLELAFNSLTGTIPMSFENLTKLEHLNLAFNKLTGTIPQDMISNAVGLEYLNLAINSLSGTIPSNFVRNSNHQLRYIALAGNLLDGSIPSSMFALQNLEELRLYENLITGTIPSPSIAEEIGSSNTALQYILWIDLDSNLLTGTIPTSLGSLEYLEALILFSNNLSGTVPSEIGKLLDLTDLYFDENQLMGTIPSEIGLLTKLIYFFADNNNFTGTLPSTFSRLSNLDIVDFKNTSINGDLDSIFCDNRETKPIGLISADCGGSQPEVNCTCCTVCCNDDSVNCEKDLYNNCIRNAIPIENGAFFNDDNLLSVCYCAKDGRSVSCEQRMDSNNTFCESCNEDGTVCGIQTHYGWEFNNFGIKMAWYTSFTYTLGQTGTIFFYYNLFSKDRRVFVNEQECSSCNGLTCEDEFETFSIECRNLIGDSSGYYNGCNAYLGGVFDVFLWYFRETWTGCKPFWYFDSEI